MEALDCKTNMRAMGPYSDEYANRIPNPNTHLDLSTPRLRYYVPKINNPSAEQLGRAMLLLPLPYKKPCCN